MRSRQRLAYLIYINPWLTRRLYRFGIPVMGILVGKRTTTSRKSGVTTYHLSFSYPTPDGETREREMIAHSSTNPEIAHLNQTVTVLYDPERPKRSIAYEYGPYRCLET